VHECSHLVEKTFIVLDDIVQPSYNRCHKSYLIGSDSFLLPEVALHCAPSSSHFRTSVFHFINKCSGGKKHSDLLSKRSNCSQSKWS